MDAAGWLWGVVTDDNGSLNAMRSAARLRLRALLLAPLLLLTLAACAPTVALQPAADATNPKCADVIVHLPTSVATYPIRQTDAQATSAWGNPASVLLRCGVPQTGPTADLCYSVKGIDWVEDSSRKPTYVYTTFGRKPAVQVVIDSKLTDGQGTIILDALADAVGEIKQKKHVCTTVIDPYKNAPSPSPTPTP